MTFSNREVSLRNPLIVALDVDSRERLRELVMQLNGKVGAYKVGPRLMVRYGADLIDELARLAPVFVDNKYLDIPSTMESSVRASFAAGASLTTVHAWAGREALSRLAVVEQELRQERPFRILVVTILTSFNQENLPPTMSKQPIADQVEMLARLAQECGLSGLVCSPQEIARLRNLFPNAFLVTPGIRLPSDDHGDQKRVESPRDALRAGASALVVGRPIIDAVDPVAAADRFLAALGDQS